MQATAKVNMNEKTIELTGSEEFVSKNLDAFNLFFLKIEDEPQKPAIAAAEIPIKASAETPIKEVAESPVELEPVRIKRVYTKRAKPVIIEKVNHKKEKIFSPAPVSTVAPVTLASPVTPVILAAKVTDDEQFFDEVVDIKAKPPIPKPTAVTKITTKAAEQVIDLKINVEEFDINAKGRIPSLSDFIKSKDLGVSVSGIIAAVGYYLTKLRGQDYFTSGNVAYAYQVLSLPGRPRYLYNAIGYAQKNNNFIERTQKGRWKLTQKGVAFIEKK